MTELNPATFTLQMDVTIRPLKRADLAKLEWYGQYAHFRNLFRRSFREQRQGNRLMLVADLNGFPIGRLFIQFYSQNHQIADGFSRGYLYSFQMMELFRGRGIGTRMMQEAEGILRSRRFRYATIAVAKDNVGALRLYRRLGYHQFSESPGRWRYLDHRGIVHEVNEPSWLLERNITEN